MEAQTITIAGAAPTFAEPLAADTAPHGTFLVVRNDSGASVTVTVATAGNLPTGDDFPDKEYAVAAAGEAWIPLLLPSYRSTADPQTVDVSFSAVASVTAAAIT